MNKIFYKTLLFLGLSYFSQAANINITFDPTDPVRGAPTLDPYYNDGESSIFQGIASDNRVIVSLSGRDYTQDPTQGQIWGLLDNMAPGNEGRPGWLVRLGWESNDPGIPTYAHADGILPPAYLLLSISRPDDLMFDSITLTVENPVSAEFVDTWASSSADNYINFSEGVKETTPDTEILTVTLDGLDFAGPGPLLVKLYGIMGEDDGTFGLSASVTTSLFTPVPEPSSLLLMSALGMLGLRRKRR